jgi:hypothetical protein
MNREHDDSLRVDQTVADLPERLGLEEEDAAEPSLGIQLGYV